MSNIDLIANKYAWDFTDAVTVSDHQCVEKLFIDCFDDLKRAVVADGKNENVAVDTCGVAHAKF